MLKLIQHYGVIINMLNPELNSNQERSVDLLFEQILGNRQLIEALTRNTVERIAGSLDFGIAERLLRLPLREGPIAPALRRAEDLLPSGEGILVFRDLTMKRFVPMRFQLDKNTDAITNRHNGGIIAMAKPEHPGLLTLEEYRFYINDRPGTGKRSVLSLNIIISSLLKRHNLEHQAYLEMLSRYFSRDSEYLASCSEAVLSMAGKLEQG